MVDRLDGLQIARDFRLWSGNDALLRACLAAVDMEGGDTPDPTMVIVREMWRRLRATHILRLVK